MARRVLLLSVLAVFVMSLEGCATAGRNKELEIQGLRNQINALESQLRTKDEELNSLKTVPPAPQEDQQEQLKKAKKGLEAKERPSVKQVQVALKNAGYYSGVVDGRMGRQTREAVKAFQKANSLQADGRVGKKTWKSLREYLSKKVK